MINGHQRTHSILAIHRADDSGRNGVQLSRTAKRYERRGERARNAKEIDAFYTGYQSIADDNWEFIVKLDGDIGFSSDYFEKCLELFRADPKLGIGGGLVRNLVKGQLHDEPGPRFHVRGATKIYRRSCWEQIGGVPRTAGWDTLDELKANMLGWTTRTFKNFIVVHYRVTGAANGSWQNSLKNGVWSYVCGYHPAFMLARCVNRIFEKPYFIGSFGLLSGFLLGYIKGMPQVEDEALVRYVRRQQMRRLLSARSIWY